MEAESLSMGSPAAAISAEAERAGIAFGGAIGGVTEGFAVADEGAACVDAAFRRCGSVTVLSAAMPEILCDNTVFNPALSCAGERYDVEHVGMLHNQLFTVGEKHRPVHRRLYPVYRVSL